MARRLSMVEVGVYIAEGAGDTLPHAYGTLCPAADWIATEALGPPPVDLTSCNNTGCLCTWEGDGQLRPAEPSESRNWFLSMRRLSDQANIEAMRDL